MGDFSSVSKFRVNLVHSDGGSDRVVVQIGLDGLKIIGANDNRTMRSYELGHISRWQCRGNNLILYTRTPVDVEERQTTLQGDDTTIRNTLDTLTCSCMQLAELLQSKQTDTAQETANSLHALVAGGGKKKTPLPSADEVEYWKSPDKAGWLQSQGDHLKNWRKRWFVLKQGYLFRFMNNNVSESTKPRGVVDLSKVQDVKAASSITAKPNSIQLKTSNGSSVCYIAESETELVEWMSALEGAIARIVKHLAGVDDEPAPKASSKKSQPSQDWIKQLEKNFDNMSTSSSKPAYTSSNSGRAMVDIVGYETLGGGSSNNYRESASSAQDSYREPSYGMGNQYSGSIGYGQVAGASSVGTGGLANDTMLNYGAAAGNGYGGSSELQRAPSGNAGYPAPSSSGQSSYYPSYGQPASSYNQQQYTSYGQASYGQAAQPVSSYQPSHGQQQPLAAPAVSLIDQVPHQQPAYPAFQQAAAPQAPAPSTQAYWQVHYTAEGRPYYYNTSSGSTQWEAPAGYAA